MCSRIFQLSCHLSAPAKWRRPRCVFRILNTEADAQDFIAGAQEDLSSGNGLRLGIVLRESDKLCGGVGLRIEPDHRRAELGYWIGAPYWGNGYATEAAAAVVKYGFGTLGLHRIFASHFANNPASARVLRKIGMRHEGSLRAHVLKWGEFLDLEMYGMVSDVDSTLSAT